MIMAQKVHTTTFILVALIVPLVCFYHQLVFPKPPVLISAVNVLSPPFPLPSFPQPNPNNAIIRPEEQIVEEEEKLSNPNNAIVKEEEDKQSNRNVIPTVSILLPAWEILVIISPGTPLPTDYDTGKYTCLFPNNDTTPAKPSGILPFPYRATFKCDLPERVRRRLPFPQPVLTKSTENPPERKTPVPELLRWNFLVYDSLSTENDVILFVKGVNNRQGVNRAPNEFRCVFSVGDDVFNGVRTAVTTSIQEVFRCRRPELSGVSSSDDKPIKISLEIPDQNLVVPSVAYYAPPRKVAPDQPESLLCACTMVYNAAKFLKEWVVYHSEIGIEKFVLYDNGSDDNLERVVAELVEQGYNVTTLFWLWPKTQEAGFSHCAVNAKDSCTWMAYIDVDEFVYSPSWINLSNPSDEMLKSLLPKKSSHGIGGTVGQVMINCYEFGPSNQKSHPVNGVTQGYNCRRKEENRHKSIVLLDAIEESLLNVIHHFQLKDGYKVKKVDLQGAVVNHYKFQAWSEFKAKFRRRVSAYVVDWMQAMNLESKDRTPGLGYAPVEPQAWSEKFCEVYDNRLKDLMRRWFGVESQSGYRMAWQI
ncbi:hypothetical protein RHGRI_022211 [Rhododendron griersonianum]|uniref:Glycosyltransferase family 92 protein n=1 Tax=Rhododendron griersonianum TaxID=479676 RepID=A0AAV6JN84_9ERIC|nr:hypothetical protein RHGRI_022211 [Rhododendron griersonianum]